MNVRNLLTCLSFIFLFFSPFINTVHGQGWQWARHGSAVEVEGWATAADNAGNSFCAGWRVYPTGTLTFSGIPVPTTNTPVWAKYDKNGNVLWTGSLVSGNASLINLATDQSGNLIIYGSFGGTIQIGSFTLTNPGSFYSQYFLAKISPSGTVLWAINDGSVFPSYYLLLVSAAVEGAGNVTTDAAGNIYITSSFSEPSAAFGSYTLTNADPSGSTYDMFVAKYDPSGVLQWATAIGGTKQDYATDIAVAATGEVYISGTFYSPAITVGSSVIGCPYFNSKGCIVELSATGTPLWAQDCGDSKGTYAIGVEADKFGGIYFTGGFRDPTITFGSTTLSRVYPSASQPAQFLLKYNAAHAIAWSHILENNGGGVWPFSIAYAGCGQIWVGSGSTGPVLLAPGDTIKPAAGSDPAFIAGFDLGGAVIGKAALPAGGDDELCISADPFGNVYFCGDFFNPGIIVGPDTLKETASGEYIFLAKYANTSKMTPDTTNAADTFICRRADIIAGGITLVAPPGYANYYWDNGTTAATRTVTAAGKYDVYALACGEPVLHKTYYVSLPDTTYNRKDTTVCISVPSVTLNAPAATSYLWSNGSTSASVTVSSGGVLWVYAVTGCSTVIDTFRVTFSPYVLTARATDTAACSDAGNVILYAPSGYPDVLWSTGSTATSLSVAAKGTYWVRAIRGCDLQTDTFRLNMVTTPMVSLGADTGICPGDTVKLATKQPAGYLVLWSTGSNSSSVTITDEGKYWLSVRNGICLAADTVSITKLAPPDPVHLGPDTVICADDVYKLSVDAGKNAVLWSTGVRTSSIDIQQAGIYAVTVSNTCGKVRDSVKVDIDPCEIWLPNAFTPNADNHNDVARVMGSLSKVKEFTFNIYNRWGERIFETHSVYDGWDGLFRGVPQDMNTYMYEIIYVIDGRKRLLKGDLTLIR